MTQPIYAAYSVVTRHFYQDDGGGSSTSKHLLTLCTDLDLLRTTINERYADPERVRSHYGTTLAIPADAMRSNNWSGNGGGCGAGGHVEIREFKQLEFK